MKKLLLAILLVSLSFSYYYFYLVDASDHTTMNLAYDNYVATPSPPGPLNGSYSYADNSLENPDAELRICADTAAELQNKWVAMVYADGVNAGDYLEITTHPVQITSVPPINCVYVPLDISSFKAWYPSIPFVFISDSSDLSGAERHKLIPSRGWLVGNYTLAYYQTGNIVNVTVTSALDDLGNPITPDVDYLVVGLLRDGTLETTDTGITSLNDEVSLSLGSYAYDYHVHVNGIGPGSVEPEVTIISPEPITYYTNTIPFTYSIISYYDLASCWYVLDGYTHTMPDCTVPYVLTVADGTHHLELFAEDVVGQVGSDSVTFSVSGGGGGGGGGGGAGHVEQPIPPVEPPPYIPPAYELFTINPEDIDIIINYPLEGEANFTLYSATPLEDVACFVTSDFEEYAKVELGSTNIPTNSSISGTIIVEMPPVEILEYDGDYQGRIQCVGKSAGGPSLMLSTAANLYLEINKPWLVMEDVVLTLYPGEQQLFGVNLTNIGNGSSYTYATTLQLEGPDADMFRIISVPSEIHVGETKEAILLVSVPYGAKGGEYVVPVHIYENGKPLGGGTLGGDGEVSLFIGKEGEIPVVCTFPIFLYLFKFNDLIVPWTFLIALFILTWALLQWNRKTKAQEEKEKSLGTKERRMHELKLQLKLGFVSILPILLSLPDTWVFTPCFMMNVALLEFIVLFIWKLKQERDKRKEGNSLSK